MRPLPLALLLGCGPKAPPQSAAATTPAGTWSVRVASATTRPEPLASVLHDVYDLRLLISAQTSSQGLTLVVGSAGEEGAQDLCAPTITLGPVQPAADGSFRLEGLTLPISADRFGASVVGAAISGSWTGGSLALHDVSGLVDTAVFAPRMGSGTAPDAICKLLPALGPCLPCQGAAAETCWQVGVSELPLSPQEGGVTPRTREAICADPTCSDRPICAPSGS